jgi:DNA-binding transcriptional ArsR family regulator
VNNKAQLDRTFAALAHPVRRAVVERLAAGPATVGEASAGLGVSKPAVSKHMRVLEDAGVIERRVEGRTHRLGLCGNAFADAGSWLEVNRHLDPR